MIFLIDFAPLYLCSHPMPSSHLAPKKKANLDERKKSDMGIFKSVSRQVGEDNVVNHKGSYKKKGRNEVL